ncbi:hypothetical protein FKM82_014200 [Ascaphus truei]
MLCRLLKYRLVTLGPKRSSVQPDYGPLFANKRLSNSNIKTYDNIQSSCSHCLVLGLNFNQAHFSENRKGGGGGLGKSEIY